MSEQLLDILGPMAAALLFLLMLIFIESEDVQAGIRWASFLKKIISPFV